MRELTIFNDDGVQQTAGSSLAADTYYAELSTEGAKARVSAVQWVWDATAVVTVTVEDSNLIAVTPYSAAASTWDPVSGATVPTISGGAAGNDVVTYVDWGAGRRRIKLVVGTAGVVRVYENHKF